MKRKSVVQSSMSMVAMTVKTMDVLIEIANGQIQQMKRRRRQNRESLEQSMLTPLVSHNCALLHFGLDHVLPRRKSRVTYSFVCPECHHYFNARRPEQKYCSRRCAMAYRRFPKLVKSKAMFETFGFFNWRIPLEEIQRLMELKK
jgi:hypothetical protein